jgi:hypothetical protein
MTTRLGPVVVLISTLACCIVMRATTTHAQTSGLIGGTMGVSLEPAGPAGDRFLDKGLGGSALAGGVIAGISISPKVVLGVESTFSRGFTDQQTAERLGARYQRTHRDTIVSSVVRYRVANRLVGVVGGSVVRSATSEIRTDTRFVVAPGGGGLMDTTSLRDYSHTSAGLVAGADVVAGQWGRLIVSPSVRFHWFDQDEGDISVRLGLGHFVARAGVNVAVQF